MDEVELIQRCRRHDRDAHRELFERTSPRVYRLLLRMTGDADLAFDLTQETFVKGLTRIAEFDGRSSVTTWLHRIAVNEALQSRRSDQLHRRKLDELAGVQPANCDDNGRLVRSLDVEAALLALAAPERTLLLLRYQEGYDYRTIAELTGLPLGTIASRLSRARDHLRAVLGRAYGIGEEVRGPGHPTTLEPNARDAADPARRDDVLNRNQA